MPRRILPRRIIQIACSECVTRGDIIETLYALCDDGTVWVHQLPQAPGFPYWEEITPVPEIDED